MNKSIIGFTILFSSCLLGIISQTPGLSYYTYMPMTKSPVKYGEEICRFTDIKDNHYVNYVKPCQEGKICKSISTTLTGSSSSNYLYACKTLDDVYDNSEQTCETTDNNFNLGNGIDCTGKSCRDNICGGKYCPEGQVRDLTKSSFTCVNDDGICIEHKSYSDSTLTINHDAGKNKKCVEIELEANSQGKRYMPMRTRSNYIASVEDGKYIEYIYYMNYCKSGFALYFYGNNKLAIPDKDDQTSEDIYARCVTILGRDSNGIIKYTINNGDPHYYDDSKLPSGYSLGFNNENLMLKLELFNDYKKRMDELGCRATGCKDDDELKKLIYFYYHPEEYLLYKDEPQVVEYLIKENGNAYSYKVQHTSSTESSNLLNIKYFIAFLSLILLF